MSHLIDMAAEGRHLSLALHGAQVAVAAVPVAAAWEAFLAEFDPPNVDADRLFPDAATLEPVVRRGVRRHRPIGKGRRECWNDYRRKLERWKDLRPRVEVSSRTGHSTGRS